MSHFIGQPCDSKRPRRLRTHTAICPQCERYEAVAVSETALFDAMVDHAAICPTYEPQRLRA